MKCHILFPEKKKKKKKKKNIINLSSAQRTVKVKMVTHKKVYRHFAKETNFTDRKVDSLVF